MSGSSYSEDCPSCDGKETVNAYSDHKDVLATSGTCRVCGWYYYVKEAKMSKKALAQRNKDLAEDEA